MAKKYYTIIAYKSIDDPEALARYGGTVIPLVAQYGGRVVSRGMRMPLEVKEAGTRLPVTLLEWDDLDQALGMYNSDAYQAAFALIDGKVVRDVRVVAAD